MAELIITFNGEQKDLDDFCSQHGYREKISNPDPQPDEGEEGHDTWTEEIDNPESKVEFFTRKVKEFVWESVKAQRADKAAENARKNEVAKTIKF